MRLSLRINQYKSLLKFRNFKSLMQRWKSNFFESNSLSHSERFWMKPWSENWTWYFGELRVSTSRKFSTICVFRHSPNMEVTEQNAAAETFPETICDNWLGKKWIANKLVYKKLSKKFKKILDTLIIKYSNRCSFFGLFKDIQFSVHLYWKLLEANELFQLPSKTGKCWKKTPLIKKILSFVKKNLFSALKK